MSVKDFSDFLRDFNFCISALSGITDPFGSWYDGYTLFLRNLFRFRPLKVTLPFHVFLGIPRMGGHAIVVIIHIPYMRHEAGVYLGKLLTGLGYFCLHERLQDLSLTRITRNTEAGIRFDEEILSDEGLLDTSTTD